MTRHVERARGGKGPALLVADTYRWREHCGPNYDNDLGYRSEKEFEKWRCQCPIEAYRAQLVDRGELTPEMEKDMIIEIQMEIDSAFDAARSAPFPDPETAGLNVYA